MIVESPRGAVPLVTGLILILEELSKEMTDLNSGAHSADKIEDALPFS